MTETNGLSYKNFVSGALALGLTLLAVVTVFLACLGIPVWSASPKVWIISAIYLAIVSVFTAFIETTIVPKLKTGGLLRTLFVYYALGTFLAVVIVALLVIMSGTTAFLLFDAMFGLYAWMVYVANVSAARPLYPLIHKLLWKQSI